MTNDILEKFVKRHYKEVLRSETGVYNVGADSSVVLVRVNPKNQDLEVLTLDMSQSDYSINLNGEQSFLENYTGTSIKEYYPNVFNLNLTAKQDLYDSHRTLTVRLMISPLGGDLDSEELKYYNERYGIDLPLNVRVIGKYSCGGTSPTLNQQDLASSVIKEWLSDKECEVRVFFTTQNGPLHYYLNNNRKQ
ncbi:MAG: hypothetical protein V1859_08095 [archaeon]